MVSQPESVLAWMECLADPTRLRLLRLLEHHELGVAELCDVLQLPQSTVSRHLKVLSDLGFVRNHRQATTNLYRMILDELNPAARRLWLLAREQTESWATYHQDQLRLTRRLRDREADSQAFFAGAAGEWDRLRTELYGRGFTLSAMLALLPPDHVIADLGCGTGPLIEQLAPHVRRVIGVDSSAAMLKAAKKRTDGLDNVELRRGDLTAVPIEDQTCDAALMVLALTYVPDPAAALREMARILKPAGRAVIVDLLPHDRDDFRRQMGQQSMGFSAESIKSSLHACGLTHSSIRSLAPETNVKGPALFLATATRTNFN
jgi:ArsR family transcriptional regulator